MAISSTSEQKALAGTEEHEHSDDYRKMLTAVVKNFEANVDAGTVLFSVASDKATLWEMYLSHFPEHDRQHYNCHECRKFFERYADLVTVDKKGRLTSVMFGDGCGGAYAGHFSALAKVIENASIERIHVTEEKRWGLARTGPWQHFAVTPPVELVWNSPLETSYQEQAKKKHDFETMVRALVEFTAEHLDTAMQILESDALYRGEKVIGPARWLQEVIKEQNATKNAKHRHNLLWRAVATCPVGYSHPRGNMIGTLLEDIQAGLPFDEIAKNFKAKMNPNTYQRPQTAPGAQNIAQAEKLVASLGVTESLKRRFARLEDIAKVWSRKAALNGTSEGVFGNLTPREQKEKRTNAVNLPSKKMTVEKFLEKIVPVADEIEVKMASLMSFGSFVTAVDPSAPPILQWDEPDNRNPVSWYVYTDGSTPSQWGLRVGSFINVVALSRGPAEWRAGSKFPQHGERLMFVLEDCRDSKGDSVGLALFPECLRSELHSVRKTIEAFSAAGRLEGLSEASASGVLYTKGDKTLLTVRVRTGTSIQIIELDRWE